MRAVVITHHITSYAVVVFIGLWSILSIIRKERGVFNPTNITIIGLIACSVWLVYGAILTINYIAPNFINAIDELTRIIAGEAVGRELFRDLTGILPPIWERLAGYLSVTLITIKYTSWINSYLETISE